MGLPCWTLMMAGVVPIFLPSAATMSAPCGRELTSTCTQGFGFLMTGGFTTTLGPASTVAGGGGVCTLAPASATAGGGGVTALPLFGSVPSVGVWLLAVSLLSSPLLKNRK